MTFPSPKEVDIARAAKLAPITEFAERLGEVLRTGDKHPGADGWYEMNYFDRTGHDETLGHRPDGLAPGTPAWAHLETCVGPAWEVALLSNGASDPTDRVTTFKIRPKPSA